jgi:hypothetical protein
MIRHSWKITVVAFAVLPVVVSSQAAGAATNYGQSVKFGLQPNACTAIAPAKLDLASVRASLEQVTRQRHGDFEPIPSDHALA